MRGNENIETNWDAGIEPICSSMTKIEDNFIIVLEGSYGLFIFLDKHILFNMKG